MTMTLTTMKLVATVIRIVLVMDLFGRDGDHDIDNNTTRPNLGPLSKQTNSNTSSHSLTPGLPGTHIKPYGRG